MKRRPPNASATNLRNAVLRGCMGILILLTALTALTAGAADETPHAIAKGVYLLPGQLQAGRSADGNSTLLQGRDGWVLIDSGRGGAHTQHLLDWLAAQPLPLRAVINTHWHLDHIGGNARLRAAIPGLKIYAHPSLDTALAGFHADNRRQLEAYLPTLPADAPDRARLQAELDLLRLDRTLAATDAVSASLAMKLGGRAVEINVSAHAVTEGDLWVFDPASKTLMAGDLVTLPVPLFDSACPEGWQQALAALGTAPFRLLVPGHGAPMPRQDFTRYRRAYDQLLHCAATGEKSACIDGWFKDAAPLVAAGDEAYGRALLDYYWDGFLKPGAAGRARWCAAPPAP